jgi:hypothetical protein
VQLTHVVDELALGGGNVEQRLAGLGEGVEDDEIDRVSRAQRDADLRVVLEAADAGAVSAARIDDHVRPAARVDRHALGRDDAKERVVDRTRQRASVHDHFVLEVEHRRQALPLVLEEVVAALAQRVPEQDRALREVDCIARSVRPSVPRQHRLLRQLGGGALGGLAHALGVALDCDLGAGLQDVTDLRGQVLALGQCPCRVVHGVSFRGGRRPAHGSGVTEGP